MGGGMALLLSPPFICSAGGFGGEGERWWQSQVLLTFLNWGSHSISSQTGMLGGRGEADKVAGSWGCSVGGCQWLWLQPPLGEALGFSSWFSH